jgi:hypothetical protein
VMLSYLGAGHAGGNMTALRRRELEFFDHFLQGKPAPGWWKSAGP